MFKKRTNKATILKLTEDNEQHQKQQDQDAELRKQPTKKIKFDPTKKMGVKFSTKIEDDKEKEPEQSQNSSNKMLMNYKAGTILQPTEVEKQIIPFQQQQAKMRFMENIEITKLIREGKISTNIYRGKNAYANYQLTPQELENGQQTYKKRHGVGPSRVSNNVKNTCRFDYNQSLCKDWHDTGYCVFGNSCIYLHDRSNDKTGWQLQKQFQQSERQRWKRINNPDLRQQDDHLKQAQKFKVDETCKNCQNILKNPVSVECGHIFCQKCAGEQFHSTGKCKICSKRLTGIFNNVSKQLEKKKQLYDELVKKLQRQKDETNSKRKKNGNMNSLDVFGLK